MWKETRKPYHRPQESGQILQQVLEDTELTAENTQNAPGKWTRVNKKTQIRNE